MLNFLLMSIVWIAFLHHNLTLQTGHFACWASHVSMHWKNQPFFHNQQINHLSCDLLNHALLNMNTHNCIMKILVVLVIGSGKNIKNTYQQQIKFSRILEICKVKLWDLLNFYWCPCLNCISTSQAHFTNRAFCLSS